MQISYLSIRNFRGIKKLDSYFDSKFICLIGSGDSCKTTVLTAIEYALTQRWNINFDDSDFYDQDVSEPITISITLTDWNNEVNEVRNFFQESKFGQFIGGLTENGPIDEPEEGCKTCITLQLQITSTLEPIWQIIKGAEIKQVSSADRAVFALGRIDSHLDNNFTWGRNTSLTKLSTGNGENLNVILSNIARVTKNNKISLDGYNTIAESIQIEAIKMGVKLNSITPKIDIQKVSLATGALSLHEAEIPLRNFGAGSKKLISCAIHSQLNKGRNITLIDELETGLEPHRIRGLIKNLKTRNQQIITTTHSPVVLRELTVKENELFVCRKDDQGNHKMLGLTDQLSIELEAIFNRWSRIRISDPELKRLIQLAMVPNKETYQLLTTGKESELSSHFNNTVSAVFDYSYHSPSQLEATTKGTLFGFYNAITGYHQNVRNYRDDEAKFKSIMQGMGLQRNQSAFDLCGDFAKYGNSILN